MTGNRDLSSPITVVHILPSIALVGGTSRRVHDHIAGSALEHHVLLHDLWLKGDADLELSEARRTPHVLDPICFSASDWAKVTRRILELKGSIVLVSYFPKGHAFAQALSRLSKRVSHVVSLPGLDHLGSAARRAFFRSLLSNADFVFANSELTRLHYQPLCPRRRIHTIYNPVTRYADLTYAPRNSVSLVSCGGLAPVKEYHRALQLCAFWRREGTPFHYELAGDGPLRGEFSAFITEGGLTSVSMLGYRPLDELLQPHHVFIHPCDREGFGLAPAEAALSGIPVVIAHHAGAAEVLTAAGHVLAIDFGAPLELVSSQILTFAKTVRVVKSEVDELRRRLGTTNYACSVDSAIVAVARHF